VAKIGLAFGMAGHRLEPKSHGRESRRRRCCARIDEEELLRRSDIVSLRIWY